MDVVVDKVITMVHGTFARGAKWAEKGSHFCNKISDGGKVEFDTFEWSGANSHQGRLKAGIKLSKQLQKNAEAYPNAEQVIIAHSHGGNIALYAIKLLRQYPFKLRLVTISTPFLIVSKRTADSSFASLSILIYLVSIVLLIVACFKIIAVTIDTNLFFIGFLVAFFALLFGMGISANFAARTFDVFVKLVDKKINKIDHFDFSSLTELQSLSVIIIGDEASRWLNGFPNLLRILNAIYHGVTIFIWYLASNILSAFALVLILFVPLLILRLFFPNSADMFLGGIAAIYICSWVLSLALYFCLSIILFPTTVLLRSNPVFFGWENWYYTLFMKISVNIKPNHLANNIFKEFESKRNYKHGEIFMREDIIEYLSQWIFSKEPSNSIGFPQ